MKLLSMVSKGNRIATVRTYGAAGYMLELTEFRIEGGGYRSAITRDYIRSSALR